MVHYGCRTMERWITNNNTPHPTTPTPAPPLIYIYELWSYLFIITFLNIKDKISVCYRIIYLFVYDDRKVILKWVVSVRACEYVLQGFRVLYSLVCRCVFIHVLKRVYGLAGSRIPSESSTDYMIPPSVV